MKKSLAAIAASIPLVLAAPVLAQGIGHSLFMRGSIIGADSQGTIVCIGKADGAKVGVHGGDKASHWNASELLSVAE